MEKLSLLSVLAINPSTEDEGDNFSIIYQTRAFSTSSKIGENHMERIYRLKQKELLNNHILNKEILVYCIA